MKCLSSACQTIFVLHAVTDEFNIFEARDLPAEWELLSGFMRARMSCLPKDPDGHTHTWIIVPAKGTSQWKQLEAKPFPYSQLSLVESKVSSNGVQASWTKGIKVGMPYVKLQDIIIFFPGISMWPFSLHLWDRKQCLHQNYVLHQFFMW
jgi:hypothetical protein